MTEMSVAIYNYAFRENKNIGLVLARYPLVLSTSCSKSTLGVTQIALMPYL